MDMTTNFPIVISSLCTNNFLSYSLWRRPTACSSDCRSS